jgi:hypothetical protein
MINDATNDIQDISQPVYLKTLARIISVVLHPLFIPTYIFFWLATRFSFEFSGISTAGMFFRKFSVFWLTAFFPAFSVFLLWRLKFIENIYLRQQKERIVPYIITMIFYWWMWYLSRNFTDQPIVLRFFYLGIFLSTIMGLSFNNFVKISMHSMGMGGALACVLLTCLTYHSFLGLDIMLVTFLTGVVCTSRLIINEHSTFEIYLGLLVGALCQAIAYWIVM